MRHWLAVLRWPLDLSAGTRRGVVMAQGPLKTLFGNQTRGSSDDATAPVPALSETAPAAANKKRHSIESVYQKKSPREHVLLRPDTYIGSVEPHTTTMWVMDTGAMQMVQRELTYVPGLYKIFDEILVNAADNKHRDPSMACIKIDIDSENNRIKIWNDGKGIPVVEHKTEKIYVPTMIFGHLLTSSNYDDSEKKVTGGRNGYGAKLCNIFSKKFTVETSSREYKKCFKQTWTDNMLKAGDAKISTTSSEDEDFTCVTFEPDLSKFKMESLDKDIVDLFTRRAYDVAASCRGVKVFLNGKRLPIKSFREYAELYIKDKADDAGQPLKLVHEQPHERWEVAVALSSDRGFQQVSFVNNIATTTGGKHVDHVVDQIAAKLLEVVKKKAGKGGVNIKPFQIKNNLWIFVNSLIENPTFDSQTKENMTLQAKSFGSKCTLSEKFINQVTKSGIVEHIMNWVKFKAQAQLNQKCNSTKRSKLKGLPKLDDANEAGTKNSDRCTLILTEGDSAKTLAVAGLSVIGRDYFGVFPLRGKVLNVREATHKQIMENVEINNIIKIMGLQYKLKYDSEEELKTLRYGKIMIMTDQDQDGSHIKGLLINFVHHNWPSLLRHNVIIEFITPIVKVSKGQQELSFYSLPEFEEWKVSQDNWHTWKVKYYKGLGTSTAKEAKEYFSNLSRHRINFKYEGTSDDASIELAFSRKKIDERKEWLTNWMQERKQRAELGLPEVYLYQKDTTRVTFNDFVNKELILFSNMDNERSIPSLVDGLKPGQRKVLFACFKRKLVKELKVAQLAGSVAEISAYHHGEQSLMGTIINLAQDFVGSNNLNLLLPIGQFGTRLHGGKDAASPRYIFTALSPLARAIFHVHDDPILQYLNDDGAKIEPYWYCPIIPMVLINGAEGIGTGWSTKIPNYDIREVVSNLKLLINGEQPTPIKPSFKDFRGTIESLEEHRFISNGEISILDDQTVEITELPVRTWTQTYKESVLEPMLQGTEKTEALIQDYKEYHTEATVKFIVKMSPDVLSRAEAEGLHKFFKLQSPISTSSMVLFDALGVIRRYNSVEDIMRDFYELRLSMYKKRKEYSEGLLTAESTKLDSEARFILEIIEEKIKLNNVPKKEIVDMLIKRGYPSDPVNAWKASLNKETDDTTDQNGEDAAGEVDEAGELETSGPDYNYLLKKHLLAMTKEAKEALLKQRDAKASELASLKSKRPQDLWLDDLERFLEELETFETQEKEGASKQKVASKAVNSKDGKPTGAAAKRLKAKVHVETQPSPIGRRVVPRIDPAMKKNLGEKAAARAAKKKDDPDQGKLEKFGFVDNDGADAVEADDSNNQGEIGSMTLAERLEAKKGSSNDGAAKPVKATKKPGPSATKATKQTKLTSFKPKKKNAWSDDSDNDGKGIASSASDDDDIELAPREKAPTRRAAAKVNYKFESESDDDDTVKKADVSGASDDEGADLSIDLDDPDESDGSFKPKKAVVKKSPVKAKPAVTRSPVKTSSKLAVASTNAVELSSDGEDDSATAKTVPSTVHGAGGDASALFPKSAADKGPPAKKRQLMKKAVVVATKTDAKQTTLKTAKPVRGTKSAAARGSAKSSKKEPVASTTAEADTGELSMVSDTDDGDIKVTKPAATKKPAAKSSSAAAGSQPKKPVAKQPAKRKVVSSDEESKHSSPVKQRKKGSDSGSDVEFDMAIDNKHAGGTADTATPRTLGRQRKDVKYCISSDSDF